ncbi:MAG: hypothetical protein Q8R83_09565 [Legionellaceae bacterium]|nr:hypothetical protein [Legionellaceae bacterium]
MKGIVIQQKGRLLPYGVFFMIVFFIIQYAPTAESQTEPSIVESNQSASDPNATTESGQYAPPAESQTEPSRVESNQSASDQSATTESGNDCLFTCKCDQFTGEKSGECRSLDIVNNRAVCLTNSKCECMVVTPGPQFTFKPFCRHP